MGIDWNVVFPRLEPPPGGLDTLRRRLAAESDDPDGAHHPRWRLRWTLATVTVVAAVSVVLIMVATIGPSASSRSGLLAMELDNPTLVRFGLMPAPTEPVAVPGSERGQMAMQRVTLADSEVIYYRVARVSRPTETTDRR